jgi:hypothetical protein
VSTLIGESSNFFARAMMGYRITKALLVGNRLGVFDALSAGPKHADVIATALGVDAAKLDVLLVALTGMELLTVSADGYALSTLARNHLVSDAPGYMGNNLRFQDLLWDNWSHLEDVVRSGKAHKSLGDLLANEDQEFTNQYIRGMQNISGPSARDVARIVGPVKRMIDVGAGPGNYSRAVLEANPAARATLLDLPTTLAVTRELMQEYIVAGRCELREGNYLNDGYGSGFDFALLSHTTHDEDDHGVASMLERAFACLESGGRVGIHDWVVAHDGQPLSAALFSLNLSVYTPGRVYRLDQYKKLRAAAGFKAVAAHTVLEGKVDNPTTLVLGTKP